MPGSRLPLSDGSDEEGEGPRAGWAERCAGPLVAGAVLGLLLHHWLGRPPRGAPEPIPGPPATLPLGWGLPMRAAGGNLSRWPAVEVADGAGTDANIPALPGLLDKTLGFTVDLSGVGCRSVLAFQMVDASINGGCYCDGNSLQARGDDPHSPGNCIGPFNNAADRQPCVEIDMMEANQYVWHSTIHAGELGDGTDGWKHGVGEGKGGAEEGSLKSSDYLPGGTVIDTALPIAVRVAFPSTGGGELKGMRVSLSQGDRLGATAEFWVAKGMNLTAVRQALQRGMTPGFSYWSTGAGGAYWYDGPNCHVEAAARVNGPATFWDWHIADGTDVPLWA